MACQPASRVAGPWPGRHGRGADPPGPGRPAAPLGKRHPRGSRQPHRPTPGGVPLSRADQRADPEPDRQRRAAAAAPGRPDRPGAQAENLAGADAVRNALRGLVPTGPLMKAVGPAKVLIITYPASRWRTPTSGGEQAGRSRPAAQPRQRSRGAPSADDRHRRTARQVTYEFRATAAETLTVVITQTALGVMDIPEAREVMSLWSKPCAGGRSRTPCAGGSGWATTTLAADHRGAAGEHPAAAADRDAQRLGRRPGRDR